MKTELVPGTADLEQIASEVWASYLDPDGDRPLLLTPTGRAVDEVIATVLVSGAWQGRVTLGCSVTLARAAAAALLGVGADEVAATDLIDAMGELANVIGGNVKGLLPERSALSLPIVRMAADGGPIAAQALDGEVCRVEATWLGEPLTVTVMEGPPTVELSAT
jgi:chemotaxis protein CheX